MSAETETGELRRQEDVVLVRQRVRAIAVELGFSLVEQTKLVTATSELARNTVVHGRGGVVHIKPLREEGRTGMRLVFEDRGPGIPDLETALRDGYSTGNGLGLGLGGARRLVSEFHIESRPGEGTRVSITKWR